MKENEFNMIKDKLDKYKYTSMNYTEYEDIENYEVICENDEIILLYGYNKEGKKQEYHYAGNKAENLLKAMRRIKDELITFVPAEWVEEFEQNGFKTYAVWNDYFLPELVYEEYNNEPELLTLEDCENASKVTLSCIGQSRGFAGQTTEWMKQWITGKAPAVPEYTKNTAAFVHRENGKIVGVICVGTYAHDSEKGAVVWVREVAVVPEHQRKGIARELIHQALVYGKKCGAKRAFLMADECNEHAIHLYESFGFKANKESAQIDMISN